MISIQDFLRYFGSPLVLSLPDIKWVNTFNFGMHHSTDVLWEINQNAKGETPYGLFFTPNGNYGMIQGSWQRINRTGIRTGTDPLYNSLVIDIDLKGSTLKTMEELEEHMQFVIKKYGIVPTIINRSHWWFHLFWIIDPDHRQIIQDTYGNKVLEVSEGLATLFDWWDSKAQVSTHINGLIRLPTSIHWKTGTGFVVETIEYNPTKLLTMGGIELFFKNFGEVKKNMAVQKNSPVVFWIERSSIINNIPFPDVFSKLEKYPRYINGHNETFKLDGTDICIVLEDWTVNRTDGYCFWRAKNAVNNFTAAYHDINERPRGPVFAFLYHYFFKNVSKVKTFLADEFWIDMWEANSGSPETCIKVFTGENYSIEVTNKRVILSRQITTKQWWTITIPKDLFSVPIEILGKAMVKVSASGAETDDIQLVYVFRIRGANKIIYRYSGKRKFNDRYASMWLFFFWEDNDLWYLYDALDRSDLPEIEVITHNGIYEGCVVLGNKLLYGEMNNKHIACREEYDLATNVSQVTVKEYLEALKTVYKDYLIVPAFLQILAMAGMNLRKNNKVYPGILLTWRTGCGKSSIRDILKTAVWYGPSARQIALPQTSPQPLKVYATDNSILWCDELTMHVAEKTEEELRNIANRDKGARGIGVDNVYYNFRAPLFITWERTFKDESLNNRFVVLVMSKNDRQEWAMEDVTRMKDFSCYEEIYKTYLTTDKDINDLHKKYSYRLAKQGVDPRSAEVWGYLFVSNDLFDLWYSRDDLCAIMTRHLKNMWFDRQEESTDEWEFQMWISKMIFAKKAQCVVEDYGDKKIIRIMFIDDSLYEKARGQFTLLVNTLNNRSKDWTPRITIGKNGLSIMIKTIRADPIDFVMDKIEQFLLLSNRYNVSRIDVSAWSTYQEGSF